MDGLQRDAILSFHYNVGVGVVKALGTIVFGFTGHVAIAGLATGAIGGSNCKSLCFYNLTIIYALDAKDLSFCILR